MISMGGVVGGVNKIETELVQNTTTKGDLRCFACCAMATIRQRVYFSRTGNKKVFRRASPHSINSRDISNIDCGHQIRKLAEKKRLVSKRKLMHIFVVFFRFVLR